MCRVKHCTSLILDWRYVYCFVKHLWAAWNHISDQGSRNPRDFPWNPGQETLYYIEYIMTCVSCQQSWAGALWWGHCCPLYRLQLVFLILPNWLLKEQPVCRAGIQLWEWQERCGNFGSWVFPTGVGIGFFGTQCWPLLFRGHIEGHIFFI